MNALIRLLALTSLIVLTLVLAGCSSKESSKEPNGSKSTPPALDAKLKIRLTDVDQAMIDKSNPTQCDNKACTISTVTLTCTRPKGAIADWAVSGCAYLDEHAEELFLPRSSGKCDPSDATGPGKAAVTGTLDGKEIDYLLDHRDGCDVEAWSAHAPLWEMNG
jgi:hypothetical protein